MEHTRVRQAFAVVTAAALLATLTAATAAAPASAAKPKCQGKTATIVGTRKAEVIRHTAGPFGGPYEEHGVVYEGDPPPMLDVAALVAEPSAIE